MVYRLYCLLFAKRLAFDFEIKITILKIYVNTNDLGFHKLTSVHIYQYINGHKSITMLY